MAVKEFTLLEPACTKRAVREINALSKLQQTGLVARFLGICVDFFPSALLVIM